VVVVVLPLFHIFHRVGIEKRVNFIFRADPQPQQQQQQEQAFDVRKPQTQISTTAATSAATATTTIISFATVRFLLGFGHTTHTHIPSPHTHLFTCIGFAFLGFTAFGWVFIVII